jgi:hypothetical protein
MHGPDRGGVVNGHCAVSGSTLVYYFFFLDDLDVFSYLRIAHCSARKNWGCLLQVT